MTAPTRTARTARRLLAGFAAIALLAACSSDDTKTSDSTEASDVTATGSGDATQPPGDGTAVLPPLPADMEAQAEKADVPVLGAEAFETHTHTMVLWEVDGEEMRAPANIGIDTAAERIAALHTHDVDGIVHVESPHKEDSYTLSQFLIMWGIDPTDAGICAAFVPGAASCTVSVEGGEIGDATSIDDIDFAPEADGLETVLLDENILRVTITSS